MKYQVPLDKNTFDHIEKYSQLLLQEYEIFETKLNTKVQLAKQYTMESVAISKDSFIQLDETVDLAIEKLLMLIQQIDDITFESVEPLLLESKRILELIN